MHSLQTSRLIHATPDHVFAVFADLDHAAERIRGIVNVERIGDGPVGAGTRWRETRHMFGKDHTEELEFTSFDAPNEYTVGCESAGSAFTTIFRFQPEGDNTRVELELTVKPLTFAAKVASPLTKMMLKACGTAMEADLDDLAAFCEGKPAPTA